MTNQLLITEIQRIFKNINSKIDANSEKKSLKHSI